MANISNTIHYNKKWNLYQRANIASGAEYWIDEQFQNLLVFGIFIVFQIKKKI